MSITKGIDKMKSKLLVHWETLEWIDYASTVRVILLDPYGIKWVDSS